VTPSKTASPPRSLRRRRITTAEVTSRRRRATSARAKKKATPRIDPRLRDRRAAVTRRQGRRRLAVLVAFAAIVLIVLGGWLLLDSRLLSARVVTVEGSAHTERAAVVAASGLATHPPMINVNPAAVAARVERLAWVGTATVRRQWPDGVVISVTERTPVAIVAASPAAPSGPSDWAEVDATGRVLAESATEPSGLVQLAVPVHPGPPASFLGPSAGPALRVAASLPRAYAAQVVAVAVGSGGQVSLKLTIPVTVDLGTTAQLGAKEEDVAALLAHATLTAGDVIDVSVPESPTVTGP